jgi:hypothetical protein
VVPELPLKMQAFDDEVVLVSMQDPAGGPPSFTAVAIHNRGAVAMLNLAFEYLWAQGQAFGAEKVSVAKASLPQRIANTQSCTEG